jgi:hypothetical protein
VQKSSFAGKQAVRSVTVFADDKQTGFFSVRKSAFQAIRGIVEAFSGIGADKIRSGSDTGRDEICAVCLAASGFPSAPASLCAERKTPEPVRRFFSKALRKSITVCDAVL